MDALSIFFFFFVLAHTMKNYFISRNLKYLEMNSITSFYSNRNSGFLKKYSAPAS